MWRSPTNADLEDGRLLRQRDVYGEWYDDVGRTRISKLVGMDRLLETLVETINVILDRQQSLEEALRKLQHADSFVPSPAPSAGRSSGRRRGRAALLTDPS